MRALLLALLLPLHPVVVGVSKPAESLTAARIIAILPPSQRKPWLDYLKRSQRQLQFDQDEPFQERSHLSGPVPPMPKEGFSGRSMPLNRDAAFYATPEARHTADTILSFQLPNGGWSKNLDMSGPARLPGQSFTPNNLSRFLGPDDFDTPRNPNWNYAGTLDNDATNTELHFLVRVAAQAPGKLGDPYRAAFIRGIYYLLNAQFPNGGWPQVWPLEGGYHDAITYNDNAVTESASTLTDVADAKGDYAFVPADLRAKARAAAAHALDCILATQVVIDGKRTVWAQQHDPLTLAPVAGRNFEPAALSAGESSDILIYLMQLPSPSPAVRASIEAGIGWLKVHAIFGEEWVGGRRFAPGQGRSVTGSAPPPAPVPRHLEAVPGAGPIWPRYTSIQTGKPVFGDRDKTIHDNVAELSIERRNGYAWYSPGPQQALDAYAAWKSKSSRKFPGA